MKMYKKSDLSLVNGMLVAPDGEVVTINPAIICQANELETLAQKTAYLSAQPAATPMPSLDGFERLSIRDKVIEGAKFEATTPLLDVEAHKTMAMMDELDDLKTVEQANALLACYALLLEFVNDEHVVGGNYPVERFDTPVLGNVLEMTQADITKVIAYAYGLEGDEDCAECDDTDCCLNPKHEKNDLEGCGYVKIGSKEALKKFFDKLDSIFDDEDEGSEE